MITFAGLEQLPDGVTLNSNLGLFTKSSLPDGYLSLLWEIPTCGQITIVYTPAGKGTIVSGQHVYRAVYKAMQDLI